jgi:hypothetical protein
MPIIIILLLALIIAQVGFWDTLTGVLGAVAMIAVLIVFAGALLLLVGLLAVRKFFR